MILQRVSTRTNSIGNWLKRVIVIVASIIFFQNPVSQQNIIGKPSHLWWVLIVFMLHCFVRNLILEYRHKCGLGWCPFPILEIDRVQVHNQ